MLVTIHQRRLLSFAAHRSCCMLSRLSARAVASYDFTQAGSQRVPGERRNRTLDKRKVKELNAIVSGLTHMTLKQLQAVAHLLQPTPGIMDDIAIANKLPRSNQARKRQEGLIAKRIRKSVGEEALEKLSDAVELAENTQALYEDSSIQGLVDEWKAGLLAGEQAVFQDVIDRAAGLHVELPAQQLGQLVRQLQQCVREERDAAEKQASEASSRQGSDGQGSSQANEEAQAHQAPAEATFLSLEAAAPDAALADSNGAASTSASAGLDSEDAEDLAVLMALPGGVQKRAASLRRVRVKGGLGAVGGEEAGGGASRLQRLRRATQLADNALCRVLRGVAERAVTAPGTEA